MTLRVAATSPKPREAHCPLCRKALRVLSGQTGDE